MKGKFYGIGVGPGDPELITIKAVNILKKIDIIICPKSRKNKRSFALDIIKGYISEKTEVLHLIFPMIYDEKELQIKWKKNTEIIYEKLSEGKNIAFITLGDPMVYSTYMYLLPFLRERKIEIETIPGITSFCAAANQANIPLAAGEESFCIVPLRRESERIDEILDKFDNIVVMKPSHDSKKLADKLIEKGYEKNFILISKCGTDDEEITYDINRLRNHEVPYLSTILIKKKEVIV